MAENKFGVEVLFLFGSRVFCVYFYAEIWNWSITELFMSWTITYYLYTELDFTDLELELTIVQPRTILRILNPCQSVHSRRPVELGVILPQVQESLQFCTGSNYYCS